MKTAILLHGRPYKERYYSPETVAQSNLHWFPWLQQQLITSDIFAYTPDIPLSYEPLWERWVKEIERYEINEDTMLVGHSCGGGFWVRYLSEHPELKVAKVVLVAPWIDVEQEDPNNMFDFKIDPEFVKRTKGTVIFHSTNDAGEIINSVAKLREKVKNIGYKEFENYGHFTYKTMKTHKFPELLTELLDEKSS